MNGIRTGRNAAYEVVSLDLFQTLVDVDSRREQVWRSILGHSCTEAAAGEYAEELLKGFLERWPEAKASDTYIRTCEIYGASFAELFKRRGLQIDHGQAVDILFREHRLAHRYADTEAFLERIGPRCQVFIVSDADRAMIPAMCEAYGEHLLISEEYQSYKNDARNAMFRALLTISGAAPGRVLHIGDSASDVLGAAREGIRTCWLNRGGAIWEQEIAPDYIVGSLDEAWALLAEQAQTDDSEIQNSEIQNSDIRSEWE